eukprot:TRINITY_DN23295_c0_g1_i1.p2 TRINITY_DN23295_c0_g1~~TRINITY_DN23295_c0_g1_i1.p2  ORF type:complete len:263 (+),score=84.73 TRINITY_DN23295_c0_g1_i1:48-836(+)
MAEAASGVQQAEVVLERVLKLVKENKEVAAGVAAGGLIITGLALRCILSGGKKDKVVECGINASITLAAIDGDGEVKLAEKIDEKGRRLIIDSDHKTVQKGIKVDAVNGRLVNTVQEVEAALLIKPPTEGTVLKMGDIEVQLKPVLKEADPKPAEPEPVPTPSPVPTPPTKPAEPEPEPERQPSPEPVPPTPPQEPLAEPTPVSSPSPEQSEPQGESSIEPEHHDDKKPLVKKTSKASLKPAVKKAPLKKKPIAKHVKKDGN